MDLYEINSRPQLIVMLTHNDFTVCNAEEIFEECRATTALYWGMKEKPIGFERMKKLFSRMKECGKKTVLEVVGYTEEEGLHGAKLASICGCDIMMGCKFFSSVSELCRANGILYMPFVGEIEGRPSVLKGSIPQIIEESRRVVSAGAWGIDLLAYRYVNDAEELICRVIENIDAPVCVAGSIDSFARLDRVKELNPAFFTIGGAFFEKKFGENFADEIENVIDYLHKK